jgi:hypothetical protein
MWQGKRQVLTLSGFGFLVLFNGRLDRQLKSFSNSRMLGMHDATISVETAKKEGFPRGTMIFLDQEEGGRMLTARCPSKYNADGNCYTPLFQPTEGLNIDIDSADSPDPSSGLH